MMRPRIRIHCGAARLAPGPHHRSGGRRPARRLAARRPDREDRRVLERAWPSPAGHWRGRRDCWIRPRSSPCNRDWYGPLGLPAPCASPDHRHRREPHPGRPEAAYRHHLLDRASGQPSRSGLADRADPTPPRWRTVQLIDLCHPNPARAVNLFSSTDHAAAQDAWQAWAKALDLTAIRRRPAAAVLPAWPSDVERLQAPRSWCTDMVAAADRQGRMQARAARPRLPLIEAIF